MIGPNNGAVINVLSYIPTQYWDGIRDASNPTSLSSYMQNCIDDLANSGGGNILLPSGVYKSTTQLDVPPSVNLIGEGFGNVTTVNTYIDASAGTNHVLSLEQAGPNSIQSRNRIQDLAILGNSTGDGIRLDYVSYITMEKILVTGCKNNIRFINDCFNNSITNSYIGSAVDFGIYFDIAGSDINVNTFNNNQFDTNTKVHFYIAAGSSYNNTISNSNFNAGGVSIWCCNTYRNTILDNSIEVGTGLTRNMYIGNKDYDGNTVTICTGFRVMGNQFSAGASTYNLEMDGGSQHYIVDNYFVTSGVTAHIKADQVFYSYFRNGGATNTVPFYLVTNDTTSIYESLSAYVKTFTDGDGTPSVRADQYTINSEKIFKTANTVATNYQQFDDGFIGQTIKVIIGDTNTTIDFTASNLKGNVGVDWSPTTGDHLTCTRHDDGSWYCDISDNTP